MNALIRTIAIAFPRYTQDSFASIDPLTLSFEDQASQPSLDPFVQGVALPAGPPALHVIGQVYQRCRQISKR